jgi:hypothetical protein
MDTVTYPDAAVAEYIQAHFVPVKLSLADDAEAAQARQLVPIWTPTVIVADGRGREVERETGFLPPRDFLAALALGRAKGLFKTARGEEGLKALDVALERHVQSALLPELLYWRGALGYNVRHDRAEFQQHWGRLQREFPDSTWSTRCSHFTPEG